MKLNNAFKWRKVLDTEDSTVIKHQNKRYKMYVGEGDYDGVVKFVDLPKGERAEALVVNVKRFDPEKKHLTLLEVVSSIPDEKSVPENVDQYVREYMFRELMRSELFVFVHVFVESPPQKIWLVCVPGDNGGLVEVTKPSDKYTEYLGFHLTEGKTLSVSVKTKDDFNSLIKRAEVDDHKDLVCLLPVKEAKAYFCKTTEQDVDKLLFELNQ